MPIGYQTAAPGGGGIAGKAQAMLQDFGPLASAYGQAASLRMQGAIAEVQGRNAATQGDANRQQQSREFADTFADSQNRFQAGLNEHELDRASQEDMQGARLQAAAVAQQRGAYIDNWLGQQKMTFADTLKAQRTDKDIADIEKAYEDKTLTKDQRDAGIAQLMGTKSKLDIKQQQARIEALNQENEMGKAKAQALAQQQAIMRANQDNSWTTKYDERQRAEADNLVAAANPDLYNAAKNGGFFERQAANAQFKMLSDNKMNELGYSSREATDPKTGLSVLHPEDQARQEAVAKAKAQAAVERVEAPAQRELRLAKERTDVRDLTAKFMSDFYKTNNKMPSTAEQDAFLDGLDRAAGRLAPGVGPQGTAAATPTGAAKPGDATTPNAPSNSRDTLLSVGDSKLPVAEKQEFSRLITESMSLRKQFGELSQIKDRDVRARLENVNNRIRDLYSKSQQMGQEDYLQAPAAAKSIGSNPTAPAQPSPGFNQRGGFMAVPRY